MPDQIQIVGTIDVRELPMRQRHGEIFRRFDGLTAGEALSLVTDQDLRPLLYQLQTERPGAFDWVVLERGPGRFRVDLSRRLAAGPRGVNEFLMGDHRRLEVIVAEAERLARAEQFDASSRLFADFRCGLERHIEMEEQILFPILENGAWGGQGPTSGMRFEHQEIRRLMKGAADAVAEGDAVFFFGTLGQLKRDLDDHNLKEDRVLSPEVERAFPGVRERDDLVRLMQAL